MSKEVVWIRGKEEEDEEDEWVAMEEGGWTRGKEAAWTPLRPTSTPFKALDSTFSLLIWAGVRGGWSMI